MRSLCWWRFRINGCSMPLSTKMNSLHRFWGQKKAPPSWRQSLSLTSYTPFINLVCDSRQNRLWKSIGVSAYFAIGRSTYGRISEELWIGDLLAVMMVPEEVHDRSYTDYLRQAPEYFARRNWDRNSKVDYWPYWLKATIKLVFSAFETGMMQKNSP